MIYCKGNELWLFLYFIAMPTYEIFGNPYWQFFEVYIFDHALLDNIGGLCDPRWNGRPVEGASLMEFLLHYGVNFARQPRDLLLQQATIAPEDASLLDSMWSSVCVWGPG